MSNKGACDFRDLFPTKMSFVVFVSYMALFINQGLLVTATKDKNNSYKYNIITVVLMTEILKLVIASFIYLKDHSLANMRQEINDNRDIFLRYFIPSFLYCLYNNLTFVNLTSYDPTTYFLLLQFRVVVTGVIFQILFSKRLTRMQWLSLILLTVGCIIKQVGHVKTSAMVDDSTKSDNDSFANAPMNFFNFSLVLILVQVFASCFAGVYNEYLLKENKNTAHIMMQNVFMYVDSIICNIILILISGIFTSNEAFKLSNVLAPESLSALLSPKVILIMVNNAAIGIVTSLFLKSLNSILKAFASALELMFTGVFAWIIFDIPLDVNTVIAIAIVSFSTWLYSRNPVQNPPKPIVSENRTTV